MRRLLLFTLVLSLLATLPAEARRFGSGLRKSANNNRTCGQSFFQSTCLAYGVIPSGYAPFSGVLTSVRVKTGPFQQGPMQIVILRSYRQNNPSDPGHPGFACCFVQRYGPVFTPRANGITRVKTTIGMVEDPPAASDDPNTVVKGDFLTLSVLRGNVPPPLHVDPSGNSGYTGFLAPAPRRGNPPAPSPNPVGGGQGAYPGYTLLVQGDIDPVKGRAHLRSLAPAWQQLLVAQV
jgi:hypothetical protein